MRLLKIRYVLCENLNKLNVNSSEISIQNINLQGFKAGIGAAKIIQKLGVLQRETMALFDIKEIANSALDDIVVPKKIGTQFISAMHTLRSHADILCNTLKEFLGSEEENSISVKLPETNDIDDIAKIMAKLQQALDQALVNPFVKGQVKLIGFDRGSNWLEIGVGSMLAIQFLAGMIRLIYESRNKEIELEAKREMVRHLKIQNDVKEKVSEAINIELEEYYAQSLDNLLSVAEMNEPEPEYAKRLGHSIRLLSELISKGLEVHPSLIVSKETSDKFPDPKILADALKYLPVCNHEEQGDNTKTVGS
ncbi:MAG: hypothetical protein ACYC6G_05205 [Desulfobaccales bacterium]